MVSGEGSRVLSKGCSQRSRLQGQYPKGADYNNDFGAQRSRSQRMLPGGGLIEGPREGELGGVERNRSRGIALLPAHRLDGRLGSI